jgi:hypothetical protein
MKTGAQGMSNTANRTGGEEPLHRVEIAQPRGRPRPRTRRERRRELAAEDTVVEPGLHGGADARRDPAAGVIQHSHDREEHRDHQREGKQGRFRPAAKHPVVDLQHVERPGQH